jgi:hypothetical protein
MVEVAFAEGCGIYSSSACRLALLSTTLLYLMYQELKHTVQHKHDLSLSSPAYPISKRKKRYETCVCLRVSASALSRTKIEGKYSKSDVFASLPLFAKQHHSTIHVGFEVLYGKLHVVLPFPKYEINNGMSTRRYMNLPFFRLHSFYQHYFVS